MPLRRKAPFSASPLSIPAGHPYMQGLDEDYR